MQLRSIKWYIIHGGTIDRWLEISSDTQIDRQADTLYKNIFKKGGYRGKTILNQQKRQVNDDIKLAYSLYAQNEGINTSGSAVDALLRDRPVE